METAPADGGQAPADGGLSNEDPRREAPTSHFGSQDPSGWHFQSKSADGSADGDKKNKNRCPHRRAGIEAACVGVTLFGRLNPHPENPCVQKAFMAKSFHC